VRRAVGRRPCGVASGTGRSALLLIAIDAAGKDQPDVTKQRTLWWISTPKPASPPGMVGFPLTNTAARRCRSAESGLVAPGWWRPANTLAAGAAAPRKPEMRLPLPFKTSTKCFANAEGMICPVALWSWRRCGHLHVLNCSAKPKHDVPPRPLRCCFVPELLF
jgi:hypothetical protein